MQKDSLLELQFLSFFFLFCENGKKVKTVTFHNPVSRKVASHYEMKHHVPEFNQKVAAFHPLSLCFVWTVL